MEGIHLNVSQEGVNVRRSNARLYIFLKSWKHLMLFFFSCSPLEGISPQTRSSVSLQGDRINLSLTHCFWGAQRSLTFAFSFKKNSKKQNRNAIAIKHAIGNARRRQRLWATDHCGCSKCAGGPNVAARPRRFGWRRWLRSGSVDERCRGHAAIAVCYKWGHLCCCPTAERRPFVLVKPSLSTVSQSTASGGAARGACGGAF